MRFDAPWDGRLRVTTAVITAVLALVASVLVALAARDGDPAAVAIAAAIAAILAVVVGLSRAFAPTGFVIEGDAVKVLRGVRPVSIPLRRVRAVGPIGPVLRGALRLGGSGGLFGWFGRYWSRPLGQFRLHATRTSDLVQLDTPDARFVLSPTPADRFLEEVQARAPGAARVPAEGPHERHPLPRRIVLRLVALVLAGPLLGAAFVIASFGWSPEGVTVDRWNVTIARRWVGPVEIPVASIRRAEAVGRDRVGRLSKRAGFADGRGHAWGLFRSSGLGEFRLYAWNRGPWVFLETDDGNVVVTPGDCARFLADLRAAQETHR